MKRIGILIFILASYITITGQIYYLNPVNGNDQTGDGSQSKPFRSLEHLSDIIVGGETIVLSPGSYSGWIEPDNVKPYNNWINVIGQGDREVTIDGITLGHSGPSYRQDKYLGFKNIIFSGKVLLKHCNHLKFENAHFKDGIETIGCNDINIDSSFIETIGPWIGTDEIMDKEVGVYSRGGDKFSLTNCEITRTVTGITCYTSNTYIANNHIHHLTHDGMRIIGVQNGLIENNRIHDLDDGVSDEDAGWSRHCDAIHIYIKGGPCETLVPNYNVTFRGNIIYDVEAQGVQFNNYYKCSEHFNSKIIFENNIFGPTGASIFNAAGRIDTLVFRNNTFVHFPEGRTFKNKFRTLQMDNYVCRISDASNEVYIYNNIFVDAFASQGYTVFDHNLFISNTQNASISRFSILDPDWSFENPDSFDGIPSSNASIMHKGTKNDYSFPMHEYDFHGTPRDAHFDIGAYEVPDQSPEPEILPPSPGPEEKIIFIDDFTDGDLYLDPWLYDNQTQGLSWQLWGEEKYYIQLNSELTENALTPPKDDGKYMVASQQGSEWVSYSLNFDAFNAYQAEGAGAMLLVQDNQNYYFIDIARDAGIVYRVINGESTMLFADNSLRMPHKGTKNYEFDVNVSEDKIAFLFNGKSFTDSDANALNIFKSGGIGFMKEFDQKHYNISYDNIIVNIQLKNEDEKDSIPDIGENNDNPKDSIPDIGDNKDNPKDSVPEIGENVDNPKDSIPDIGDETSNPNDSTQIPTNISVIGSNNSKHQEVEQNIRIFPNPASTAIYFSKFSEFKLFNSYGKNVENGQGKRINISNLPSGIYYLQIDKMIFKICKI